MQQPLSIRSILPTWIRRRLRILADHLFARSFATKATRRLAEPRSPQPHNLPRELIISLTSYPARFGTLHLTLGCLLDQTIRADRTILWIANEDEGELPSDVRNLQMRGLEIRTCDNLRSYKKLIPALEAFPNAFIATADDDLYYPANWLENLVSGANGMDVITCIRAHRIKFTSSGRLAPYLDWQFDVQDCHAREPSDDILPTGAGGILYPPHCLDPRVTNATMFQRLCPDGDDLWFYWCARLRNTHYKKVGGRMRRVNWPGTEKSSLWSINEAGGNDRMIAALEDELGPLRKH